MDFVLHAHIFTRDKLLGVFNWKKAYFATPPRSIHPVQRLKLCWIRLLHGNPSAMLNTILIRTSLPSAFVI